MDQIRIRDATDAAYRIISREVAHNCTLRTVSGSEKSSQMELEEKEATEPAGRLQCQEAKQTKRAGECKKKTEIDDRWVFAQLRSSPK